jgi:hypothetical protein
MTSLTFFTLGPPPETLAIYDMINLAATVFPAPLSPLKRSKDGLQSFTAQLFIQILKRLNTTVLDDELDDHHPWLVGVGGIKGVFEEWKGTVEWRGVE